MKKNQIDETAGRIATAMCYARRTYHISRNEVADLLRITRAELIEYEHGTREIPLGILERLFVLGYKSIQMRQIESRFYKRRTNFRKPE